MSRMSRECTRFDLKFTAWHRETPERAFACPFLNLLHLRQFYADPRGRSHPRMGTREISISRFVFHVKRGPYLAFKAIRRSSFAPPFQLHLLFISNLFRLIESNKTKRFDWIRFAS